MKKPVRLARQTPVAECQAMLEIEPLVVGLGDDLVTVMRRSVAQPATRLIGVVDDAGRLVGVLPVPRLAEGVVARLVPEALLADITDVDDVARFGHAVEARTPADVMVEPATITADATIADALRVMHSGQWLGLYVVDRDNRPVGYLDLLELVLAYVDAIEGGSPPPDA